MTVGSAQTTYSYDADGNLVSTVEPDGVTESRTYDNADQLTGVTASTSASKLDSYGLTLNADGQPTAVAVTQDRTAEPDRNFGYDSAGRLTAECDSDSGLTACPAADETSYSYDAAGNLTSSDSNGATTTNNYNADEERTSSVTGSTTTSYGYDADGNQTSAGSTSYTYNAASELVGADTSAGNYSYSYDSSGNLATTSLNGAEQSATAWDLNNPLPELAEQTSSSGSVTSEYAWNPDGALSTQTQGGAAGTGTSYYATTDWEGSVTGLVNSNGTQVSSTTYTAYGTPDTTGTVTSSIGYAGSYTLPGAGLDDMRARDYSPATAEFASADPLATVTGEPYAYVGGNPLGATDPAGLCGGWCWAAVGAAVAGTAACIIVEPCGIAEGGLAVSLGGAAVATSGITFVGGGTLVGGGIVGGLIGGGAYAISSGGSSSSSDNGDEACDNDNFENTSFSLEEIAEFARGHGGDDNPAMGRPSLSQVEDTLQNGAKSPGGGNSIRFDYKGVRVIVNLDNPLRSTTYYPDR
ncbi:MAG: RHS repeat-associated core domain-containing protein [Trebonia sp.]